MLYNLPNIKYCPNMTSSHKEQDSEDTAWTIGEQEFGDDLWLRWDQDSYRLTPLSPANDSLNKAKTRIKSSN